MNIPKEYNRLMPYLIIPDAQGFIHFMHEVFDAKLQMSVPRSEGVIMHGELRIGDSVIMFADSTEQFAARPAGIFIFMEQIDALYEKALALGCTSTLPPCDQPYGHTCGFRDPFGNDWWPTEPPPV